MNSTITSAAQMSALTRIADQSAKRTGLSAYYVIELWYRGKMQYCCVKESLLSVSTVLVGVDDTGIADCGLGEIIIKHCAVSGPQWAIHRLKYDHAAEVDHHCSGFNHVKALIARS